MATVKHVPPDIGRVNILVRTLSLAVEGREKLALATGKLLVPFRISNKAIRTTFSLLSHPLVTPNPLLFFCICRQEGR